MDIFGDDAEVGGYGGDDGGHGRDGDGWDVGGGRNDDDGVHGWDDGAEARPELPGFHVERLLGSGATAQVWLVRNEQTGALLAAKCFPAEDRPIASGGIEFRSRDRGSPSSGAPGGGSAMALERELRILGNYSHEHLVVPRGTLRLRGSWNGGWCLLMDYAPGGSVADLVAARGRLGVGETVTILTPLAQVLGYLHGQGVVHGDVSPGNVLFTAHGKPLLSDLGVGRMVGGSPETRMGTAGFAAPAEAESGPLLDPAADVYSLAAVGWYCLTGEPPPETAYRVPLPVRHPEVPQELVAALEAGLHDTGRRRPSALELGQAIYRSAPAVPVDLALAVHPSVLPELLTRRQAKDQRRPGLRRRRPHLRQLPSPAALGLRGGARARAGQARAAALPVPRPRWTRRVRAPKRWAGLAGAVAVVVLAVATAVLVAHPPDWLGQPNETSGGIAAAVQADPLESLSVPEGIRAKLLSDDPQQALSGLAWLRSYAFGAGQFPLLEQVNATGSAAESGDKDISGRLQANRHVLSGLETQILKSERRSEVGVVPALVSATAVTSGFTEQDESGSVIRVQSEAATQELEFVLVKESGHWQIAEVHSG
jgi:serine/threonine protein kinase